MGLVSGALQLFATWKNKKSKLISLAILRFLAHIQWNCQGFHGLLVVTHFTAKTHQTLRNKLWNSGFIVSKLVPGCLSRVLAKNSEEKNKKILQKERN